MSRPIVWNKEKKEKAIKIILDKISIDGCSVRSILDKDRDKTKLPSRRVFNDWLRNDDVLSTHYARVCEARAESLFEEILEIADDSTMDKKNIKGEDVVDTEVVQRSRLRIDARKWVLSKMQPKKYGDKIDMTTNGNDISTNQIDYGKLSQEALEEIARADEEDNN